MNGTRDIDELNRRPKTVDEAVDLLIKELSFGDRTIVANMQEEDLANLDFVFGMRIKAEFGIGRGNKDLLESCRKESGQPTADPELATAIIIKCLWKAIQDTPVLRVLK